MAMALLSTSPLPTTTLHFRSAFALKPQFARSNLTLTLLPKRRAFSFFLSSSTDKGAGSVSSSATVVESSENESLEKEEAKEESPASSAPAPSPVLQEKVEEEKQDSVSSNGAVAAAASAPAKVESLPTFKDPRWIGGTWDLKQFQKNGKTDWDAVIDAEARRRKWLEDNPEASSDDEPVIFDTSIIPWWAWIKRFHLPEAELLNGRAAMIGFFMAYFVDSLTGIGLVDQMGNFFCKTLLFIAVIGVLFIRKNEDIENFKKLLDETTFYDKQWQATWQDETSSANASKKEQS